MKNLNLATTAALKLGIVLLVSWIVLSPQEVNQYLNSIKIESQPADGGTMVPLPPGIPKDSLLNEKNERWPESIWFLPDTVLGLNISRYQGNLSGTLLPSDTLTFVLIKATEGNDHTDPMFAINWHNLKGKGVVVGGYHLYSTASSPGAQADFFCRTLGPLETYDLPPVLDFENVSIKSRPKKSKAKMIEELATFLKEIEDCTQKIPIICTGVDMFKQFFDHDVFYRYPVWITSFRPPHICSSLDFPEFEFPYDFWQYSAEAEVHGQQVTANVFNGDIEQFIDFLEATCHATK